MSGGTSIRLLDVSSIAFDVTVGAGGNVTGSTSNGNTGTWTSLELMQLQFWIWWWTKSARYIRVQVGL